MPQIGLQRSRIVPLVGQRIAAGVPEHVRVRLEAEPRLSSRPLNHAGETCGRKRRTAFRGEYEGRLGLLLALKPPQGAQLVTNDGVGAWGAAFDPADMQRGRPEVHLVPPQVYKLRSTEAVPIGHKDHSDVPVPPAVLPGGTRQPLDLSLSQVLAGT